MSELSPRQERLIGWALAGAAFFHILILAPHAPVALSAVAVLLIGVFLRGRATYLPRWLGHLSLLIGFAAVVLIQRGFFFDFVPALVGELGAMIAALLLLQPVTPKRGLRILVCLLAMMLAAMAKPYSGVGRLVGITDVIVLFVLAEQLHRPPEVMVSFWVSIARSMRLVVPVGLVMSAVFWLFPDVSKLSAQALTAFSGSGIMNAGDIGKLARSHRVALTARFPQDQPPPLAGSLYWRGQVLEINDQLRWSRVPEKGDTRDAVVAQITPPPVTSETIRYSEEVQMNRFGILPLLDHAVFLDARRGGEQIAVLEHGGVVLSAVGGGAVSAKAMSSLDRLRDTPTDRVDQSALRVPEAVAKSPAIRQIASRVFQDAAGTTAKLRALADYFRQGGFAYSIEPGTMGGLENFLVSRKRGFCEHYAAAAANLLRLGGVPSRVVTGYRGGEWNPWLRTITVRDSDAHAWVEAWDPGSGRWLRFDPTDAVAPEISAGVAREMDSRQWAWYRKLWGRGEAVLTTATQWTSASWDRLTSSDAWDHAQTVLFLAFVVVALVWLIRNLLSRRAQGRDAAAAVVLADVENRAARLRRARRPGETPLAWLARLAAESRHEQEAAALRRFAGAYEAGVYQPAVLLENPIGKLKEDARDLLRTWKSLARQKLP